MKAVRITSNQNESRIKLNLDSGFEYQLWQEANVPLSSSSDCWLFLLLPAFMKLNGDLEISSKHNLARLLSRVYYRLNPDKKTKN